jgi:hypothetical protein
MHPPNVNQDKNYQRLYQPRIETLEKNAAHHDIYLLVVAWYICMVLDGKR